jgi:chromosomal replication initiator protein
MNTFSRELMKYSPIFFYGKAGSGKRRLLHGIAGNFKKISKKPCLYATAKGFVKDLVYAIRNGQQESFEQKYRNNGLLIIDDLQSLASKFRTQEELLKIMKEFQIKDRQIILTADRHPKYIRGLSKELVDSCYGGLLLAIKDIKNYAR